MVGPIIITDYNRRFIDWWTEDFFSLIRERVVFAAQVIDSHTECASRNHHPL